MLINYRQPIAQIINTAIKNKKMIEQTDNDSRNKMLYHITKGWTIGLFIYYSLMIIVGMCLILYILIGIIGSSHSIDLKMYTFIVSLLSSMIFAGVCYSRKLYKALIDKRIIIEGSWEEKTGNIMYFILRPLYAVVFAFLFVVCILGGAFFVSGGLDCIINEKMVYLTTIMSSVIGYSIGRVLDLFEKYGKDKIK